MKLKKGYNWYKAKPSKPEPNSGELLTVPNMDLTVRQLMQRHQNDMMLPHFPAWFDGPVDVPDLRMMDTIEKLQWAAEAREELEGQYPKRKDEQFEDYLRRVMKEHNKAQLEAEPKPEPQGKKVVDPEPPSDDGKE